MAAADVQQEWRSEDMLDHDQDRYAKPSSASSLLPALPVDASKDGHMHDDHHEDSGLDGIDTQVENLGLHSPPLSSATTSRSSTGISYPSPPPNNSRNYNAHHHPTSDPRQSSSPPQAALFTEQVSMMNQNTKMRDAANLPTPLQTQSLDSRSSRQHPLASPSYINSPSMFSDTPMTSNPPPLPHQHQHHQAPWMNSHHPLQQSSSPRHGPLLTPGNSSPALSPHPTSATSFRGSSNSLPLPGPTSRKNSVASLASNNGNTPRVSPGFRGAPLGQTSDTESVLKQFDVYFGKVYLRGQLQKKNDLGLDGFKLQGEQWAAYTAELVGPKLRLTPMPGPSGTGGRAEEMNMEEATVEMLDGPNGGALTVNWMGGNKAVFQPVQQLSLGAPEIGSAVQDWVCAIRLSCYECSRLQEIYTSTLLRRPKFRDQVAATIEGPIKAEGMLRVKFWAGEDWMRLWVVVSDQRGDEVKKKKQGKILQAAPVRGQIHFYENSKSKRPFISMYNVSQAYAVCPSRSSINASKDNKVDEEGSLTIKLEGDVVLQRENLFAQRKGFFSSPSPPSTVARDLQALLPAGKSMFAMFQVPNAVERTKFLLGTSEAFRIYGKPGPLLFDSPTDPAAMNFGCMASSLLQQELLIGLDAVLHLPQKGESLADVKFSFGEVLRKRLIAENSPSQSHQRRFSNQSGNARRQSTLPYGVPEGMVPPSPMMAMAMRSRANSGSGFLVPQPSPGLHPTHMSPWAGSPHSPQIGPYGMTHSPRQGPLHASPYNQHLTRPAYAASNTSTDEYDANLVTDDEGEDEEYPDSPLDEDDGLQTPFRSRSGSLMAPPPIPGGYGGQVRKGSVGALSLQSGHSVPSMLGRSGRSASFTSAYGVQVVTPDAAFAAAAAAHAKKTVLELPSLNSFSDDFGIRADANKEKQRKLTAVVYPTQIVIPKNKKRKDSTNGETLSAGGIGAGGLKSATSLASPSFPSAGGAPSPSIKVNGEDEVEEEEEKGVESK
ncbi:MAG: hypothetical protein J3R72DRAFT_201522 [Linnemannia gamsii]|nr:MAG: hypothetical protein J3R72DRAFT_201522 [Linnemannia gamsii]